MHDQQTTQYHICIGCQVLEKIRAYPRLEYPALLLPPPLAHQPVRSRTDVRRGQRRDLGIRAEVAMGKQVPALCGVLLVVIVEYAVPRV